MPSSFQPTNRDFLSPINFQFFTERLPETIWFGQKVSIPGLSLPNLEVHTAVNRVPMHGEHLSWDPLIIEFAVDEDLKAWFNVFDWMQAMGAPQDLAQYGLWLAESHSGAKGDLKAYSNATLIVLGSNQRPRMEVKFRDISPTNLSGLEFRTTDSSEEIVVATATFVYLDYTPRLIS